MYDRRPASRATVGTPIVAAFTPPLLSVVVRGSCQMAISSPLARAKGPFATVDISLMPRGTSSETGRWQPHVDRCFPNAGLTALPFGAVDATVEACRSGGSIGLVSATFGGDRAVPDGPLRDAGSRGSAAPAHRRGGRPARRLPG